MTYQKFGTVRLQEESAFSDPKVYNTYIEWEETATVLRNMTYQKAAGLPT